MSYSVKLYLVFYTIAFASSIITGLIFGFRGDSHTPPIPFGIEFISLLIGGGLWIIDATKKAKRPDLIKIHKIGLIANATVIIVIIFIALL